MLQTSSSSSSKCSTTFTLLRKLFLRHFCTTNTNLLSTLSNEKTKLNLPSTIWNENTKLNLPSVSQKRNDINLPNINKNIRPRNRSQAIKQAQEVLTDYFQNIRGLPFSFAHNISTNSKYCLYELLSKIPFSSSRFRNDLQRLLRYNPINEFQFFYESIGIDYAQIDGLLNPKIHFMSDNSAVSEAALCLFDFGFPWGVLGRLYVEEVSIFSKRREFLRGRLDGLVSLGFYRQQVVGVCLAFPCLLKGEEVGFGGEFDGLLDDLKRVFVGFDLGGSRLGNFDVWFDLCRKIRVFYDLGFAKGEVGKLICESDSKCISSDYSEEVLVEKVEFFSRLGFEKTEVGRLILSNPDVLSIKVRDRVISVSSLLDHFGLPNETLLSVKQNYGYVFGRNKMINLPNILRALDLHEWFYRRMKCGYHTLFTTYDLSTPDDGVDESYTQKLETIKSAKMCNYSFGKLDIFHGIGFGENSVTMKLLVDSHASPSDLHERFEFMLNRGIEYSKLCKIISRAPKALGQDIDTIEKNLNFLVEEIGLPLDYIETILSDYSEEVLVEKVEFFSRLGFEKTEVGRLILSNPDVLSIKVHDRVISVSSLLDHFGLPKKTLMSVKQTYKHVFGRNKMVNLPNILRALDLHEWFYHRMKCGYHSLFATYDLSSPDDGVDDIYAQHLEIIKNAKTHSYSLGKLDFLHGIGFGECGVTMKVLVYARASPIDMHKRFKFMLNKGIEYFKLLKIISRSPRVFSQDIDTIEKNLNFLVEEIGLPLDYLTIFPDYLLYNLEKRIEPRFKFQKWLTEQGWCTQKYTLTTIIAVSDKRFMEMLSRIHPTAPQLWLERHKNMKSK